MLAAPPPPAATPRRVPPRLARRRRLSAWVRVPATFVSAGLGVFALLWTASERIDPVYPEMRALWSGARAGAGRAEAVSVGNSHSRALDFTALGMDAVPLWQGGADAFEAGLVAQAAARRMPGVRYVFMTASYGTLTCDNGAGVDGREDLRRELYARVPVAVPLHGDARHFVMGKLSPVVRPDHWRGVVNAAVLRRPARAAREKPIAVPPGELAAHAAGRVEGALRFTRAVETARPDVRGRVIQSLEKRLHALSARGITVVLYTPPVHPEYTRLYGRAEADAMRAAMRGLAARIPGVRYYDFSVDPALVRDVRHFADSDHLSAAGARAFSLRLRERMVRDGILR